MIKTNIPFIGGAGGYFGQQLDPQKTINMFVGEVNGAGQKALITIPGSRLLHTEEGKNNTRALFENTDNLFAVFGDTLINFDNALTPVTVGTFNTSAGYVGVQANNSQQIVFVDNVEGWVYDFSSTPTWTQISDTDFTSLNGPIDVDFLDGFIIVGFSGSNTWAISDIDDATSWNALNRAELTTDGNERITGIRVLEDLLFIFGRKVTEIWYNSGVGSSFPFVRNSNLTMQYGCAATASIARGNLSNGESVLAWLASDKNGAPTVRVTNGGKSQAISDAAIEYRIEQLDTIDDAAGYIYQVDGHTFYFLNFPTEDLTVVYDFDSGEWHDQQMIDGSQYFSCCHAYFQKKHILGHTSAGKISQLSSDFTKNDDEAIHCVRVTPIFSLPAEQRAKAARFQIEMRQGLGLKESDEKNDADFDPKVYLSFSSNGGYTFGEQVSHSIGRVGEAGWLTMGIDYSLSDRLCWRIECMNGVKNIWLNAAVLMTNEGY